MDWGIGSLAFKHCVKSSESMHGRLDDEEEDPDLQK